MDLWEGALRLIEKISWLIELIPVLILAVAAFVFLAEARHSAGEFWALVRAAWSQEWKGRTRVSKGNRNGTIIGYTVVVLLFVFSEVHSFFRPRSEDHSWIIWPFLFVTAFLALSLYILASLEKAKMLSRGSRVPGR